MTSCHSNQAILPVICWVARIATALVLLFWGAFFVEHSMEWFIKPFPSLPPLKVCLGQFLHFREGKGIWGTWVIMSFAHGGFHIWPKGEQEGEGESAAAEATAAADAIGTDRKAVLPTI